MSRGSKKTEETRAETEDWDLPTGELEPNDAYLPSYFGEPDDVLARYHHCMICGSHLTFQHTTDFGNSVTQETAKCPECAIKVRRVMHHLQ